jgi:PAS domain S-box-containing protein
VTTPGARLLIVDDDPVIRKTLGDVLQVKGYRVEAAAVGGEALARTRTYLRRGEPFDAAILDIKLPGLSGLEVLESVKAISPDTEVIFITAYASLATALQALNRGAFAYLVKPFEVEELLGTLDKAVQARALRESARRLAEEALRRSEERYRSLVEVARDVIFTLSMDGVFTSLNPVFEKVTRWSRDDWLGKPFEDILHPDDAPKAMEIFRGFLRGEQPPVQEVRVMTRTGEYRTGEITASLRVERGKPVGVLGIARDITERKRSEEALRHVNDMLEDVAKRIAHALHDEAGQMLASVYLAVAEVARDVPSPWRERLARIWQLLDQVDTNLRRLSHELRPTILDDLGLLPAIEFLAEGVSRRAGIAVTVDGTTGGRLPPLLETSLYRTVQEALTNVMRHAQATRVTVRIERVEGLIRCSVSDNGIGFDAVDVFARRGDRGLGLTGIRERLRAFGGVLEIVTAPAMGTELIMTAPVAS